MNNTYRTQLIGGRYDGAVWEDDHRPQQSELTTLPGKHYDYVYQYDNVRGAYVLAAHKPKSTKAGAK